MNDKVTTTKLYRELVQSYLDRNKTEHTPYRVNSLDELVEKLVHLTQCPACSFPLVLTPYDKHPVKFLKLTEGAKMPDKKHENDAGYDLFAVFPVEVAPGERKEIKAGIALETPDDLWVEIRGKSSMSASGMFVFPGVIDAGYRGEISAFMYNTTDQPYLIQRWQKFAQLVFHPRIGVHFIASKELTISERGEGGFGSTGKF